MKNELKVLYPITLPLSLVAAIAMGCGDSNTTSNGMADSNTTQTSNGTTGMSNNTSNGTTGTSNGTTGTSNGTTGTSNGTTGTSNGTTGDTTPPGYRLLDAQVSGAAGRSANSSMKLSGGLQSGRLNGTSERYKLKGTLSD